MNSQLHIYANINDARQDWQQSGYFGNTDFGIQHVGETYALPFVFFAPTGLTLQTFKLRQVNPRARNDKAITGVEISINTAKLDVYTGVDYDWYSYPANDQLTGLVSGYWEYYILFTNGESYISELMDVQKTAELIDSGDYNVDFSSDFLI